MLKEKLNIKKVTLIVALIAVIILSETVLAKYTTDPGNYEATMAELSRGQENALKLSGASAVISAAISLLPGDAGTPLAEKVADSTVWFMLILSALYLEKYLITLTAVATFRLLIPAACVAGIFYIITRNEKVKKIGWKMGLLGLAIYALVPTSVYVCKTFNATANYSIDEKIEELEQIKEAYAVTTANEEEPEVEEEKGFFSGITDTFTDKVGGLVESVKGAATTKVEEAETVFKLILEITATMIITTCIIPILVLCFFAWIIKTLLEIDGNLPAKMLLPGSLRKIEE